MVMRPLTIIDLKKERAFPSLSSYQACKPAPVQYLYCPRNPLRDHEQYTTEIADIKKGEENPA